MSRLREQFDGYRKLIYDNLNTIKELMKQSENLNTIIEELGKSNQNPEIKESLTQMKANMDQSITHLFDCTEKLFDQYNETLKEAMR